MEYGSIEREIHIEASPEVVYQVVSTPEHLKEWWPDDAELDRPTLGGTGKVVFGSGPDAMVEPIVVVEADPPRRFAFRWCYEGPEDVTAAARGNSLLVTFDLVPAEGGTLLRFSEAGFREKGWEAAVLEEAYQDHSRGWDHFLPQLVTYAAKVGAP